MGQISENVKKFVILNKKVLLAFSIEFFSETRSKFEKVPGAISLKVAFLSKTIKILRFSQMDRATAPLESCQKLDFSKKSEIFP